MPNSPNILATIRTNQRAFTLMEMMVAVAAVAVISVGLAALFGAVGRTVAGGKRVSLLNNYAGLIESRMRRDFEAMTRDGYVVVRQQWVMKTPDAIVSDVAASDNERIPVSADDLSGGRRRRADDIMFFVRGATQTARQPLNPDVVARGDASRIYYGLGSRMLENLANPSYLQPELNDLNPTTLSPRLGDSSIAGNPNFYAESWSLLRLETVLSNPETTTPVPYPVTFGLSAQTRDSDRQVGMQPAAGSIFRWINRRDTVTAGTLMRSEPTARVPQFTSGLVDLATTDLAEIRRIVMGATRLPSAVAPGDPFPDTNPAGTTYNSAPMFVITPAPTGPVGTRPTPPQSVDLQHAWMEQGLPAQTAAFNPDGNEYYPIPNETPGTRVRFEPYPLNLHETMRDATTGDLNKAARRADQLMLTTNVFLPRCTEFIVEWSFGLTDPFGQTVWHGPRRVHDANKNGLPDAGETEMVLPYPYYYDVGTSNVVARPLIYAYPRLNTAAPGQHAISDRLIYGYTPLHETSVLTSYFGYVDPTFDWDTNNNNQLDNGESLVRIVPWAWPRLIRVTITLSDPQNPAVESTFQFIFSTPADPNVS
ncbi:MAG: hypothetical protein HBSAPP03_29200 [Phycisphaerae bacterium]|nr:MAG: hypothetical protein HBSAPP03_29200 [Phycisphaerae bacterium]